MQQKLAEKEKAQKEENLRMLAQRAREERSGIPARPTAEGKAAMTGALAGYGSDSESGSEGDTEGDGSDRHSKRRRRGRVYELRRSARPGTCRHLNVNIRLR